MQLPEDIFKYVRKGGSQIRKKTQLFPPDGPHNRQLACEIIRVGGQLNCLFHSQRGEAAAEFFLRALLFLSTLLFLSLCQAAVKSCFCHEVYK